LESLSQRSFRMRKRMMMALKIPLPSHERRRSIWSRPEEKARMYRLIPENRMVLRKSRSDPVESARQRESRSEKPAMLLGRSSGEKEARKVESKATGRLKISFVKRKNRIRKTEKQIIG